MREHTLTITELLGELEVAADKQLTESAIVGAIGLALAGNALINTIGFAMKKSDAAYEAGLAAAVLKEAQPKASLLQRLFRFPASSMRNGFKEGTRLRKILTKYDPDVLKRLQKEFGNERRFRKASKEDPKAMLDARGKIKKEYLPPTSNKRSDKDEQRTKIAYARAAAAKGKSSDEEYQLLWTLSYRGGTRLDNIAKRMNAANAKATDDFAKLYGGKSKKPARPAKGKRLKKKAPTDDAESACTAAGGKMVYGRCVKNHKVIKV